MTRLTNNDTAELAIWVTDNDPPEKLVWWRNVEAPRIFAESAEAAGVRLGPITWYELKPGEDRAGLPPDSVQGLNVRLLVAEANVVGDLPIQAKGPSFSQDLKHIDLQKMRSATRRAYGRVLAADGRTYRPMTDAECDRIIDTMGPEVAAQEALKATKH